MAILENCTLFYARLDPKRPNRKFDKENPTWEVQIRTSDKAQKKEWEKLHLPVKAIVPDDGEPYFRVNLKKRSKKEEIKEGEKVLIPTAPVEVVDSDLETMDPRYIGNGSIGDVRIWQYEYPKTGGGTGVASILTGLQITKYIEYIPEGFEDSFEKKAEKTEVIKDESAQEPSDKPKPEVPKIKTPDVDPDSDY